MPYYRDEETCPSCAGGGVEEYYAGGSFGTSRCHGLADRTCQQCEGTGVI